MFCLQLFRLRLLIVYFNRNNERLHHSLDSFFMYTSWRRHNEVHGDGRSGFAESSSQVRVSLNSSFGAKYQASKVKI